MSEAVEKSLSEALVRVHSMKENEDELNDKIAEYKKKTDELKAGIKELDSKIEADSKIILDTMKTFNATSFETGDIVASKMSRDSVGFSDEAKAIDFLKKNFANLIKESIDKKEFNKEFKTNKALADGVKPFTVVNTTDYVVVTTKENTEKMLKHINEGKTAKAD